MRLLGAATLDPSTHILCCFPCLSSIFHGYMMT